MNHQRTTKLTALDLIIEKYTATPRNDPEIVDYTMRPDIRRSRRQRIKSRRCTGETGSKSAERARA